MRDIKETEYGITRFGEMSSELKSELTYLKLDNKFELIRRKEEGRQWIIRVLTFLQKE